MLQKIPLAGTYHRFTENTVITCDFVQFQATLTNKRLIITQGQSSESIQLQQIHGITVYDDYEEYRKKVQAYRSIRKRLFRYITGTLSIGLLFWLAPGLPWYINALLGITIGTSLSIFFPINTGSVPTPSVLMVIMENYTKEYAFEQVKGLNMKALAAFVMKVDEALY